MKAWIQCRQAMKYPGHKPPQVPLVVAARRVELLSGLLEPPRN